MPGAWYTYPSDSPGGGYGEGVDPLSPPLGAGGYLKPDVNVAVPKGVPITALDSGLVTDVHDYGRCCGGLSTTVQLDQPINSLARYESYNFLGSASTHVGQRVNAGDQIGVAGSQYGILTAFALSADPHWGGPNFHYNAAGDPRLDPRPVLARGARPGSGVTPSDGGNPVQSGSSPAFLTGLTEHIFLFVLAVVLIVVGFIIISRPAIEAGAKGAFL